MAKSDQQLRHVRMSTWISSTPAGRIFIKFCVLFSKIQVSLKSDKNIVYFRCRSIQIYDRISLSSSQSEKYFRQNLQRKSKHSFCSKIFFSPENHAICDIIWKNLAERGRPQIAVWRMRIACWIHKATNTHSGCVILITSPLQQ